MLPVLDAEGVRSADARTLAAQGITSWQLMERAAEACTRSLLQRTTREQAFVVVCGMGNNGGDGLGIARLLHAAGRTVRAVRVRHKEQPSEDNAANYDRLLRAGVPCSEIDSIGSLQFHDNELIVDAILGIGSSKVSTGLVRETIALMNRSGRPVVSVDLPTGLWPGDNAGNDPQGIVRAGLVLTLGTPKLALLLPENAPFVGHWDLLPIGLDEAFLAQAPATHRWLEQADVAALLRPRPRTGHKGNFGHALVVAGGTGHLGAAVLATRAALRSGCGLVTVHVPAGGDAVLHAAAPEAMCSVDPDPVVSNLPRPGRYSAVGIGPGLGTDPDTAQLLKRMLQDAATPLVLDADALNILAENRTWTGFLPGSTVLTPHPKEFDRLYGSPSTSGYERLERAREMAAKWNVVLVLKGAPTAICAPDGRVFFNATGNVGMAKGGSGDVLTGLLTGLLAQGYGPLHAAVLGVHLHGLAGDLLAGSLGMDGMKAGDLVEQLPGAWRVLRSASEQPLDGAFPLA